MVFGLDANSTDKVTKQLRQSGDKARDRGDWDEAAKKYQEYLDVNKDDFAIWVQLGHALKESGRYREALSAYDRAISVRENDYDVHLSRGHLLKLMARKDDALLSYKRSLSLRKENNDALKEIIFLGAGGDLSELDGQVERSGQEKVIYFDMTDLMEYVKHNPSLSGIQRVAANLIENINTWVRDNPGYKILPVIPEYDTLRVFAVSHSLVMAMINALRGNAGRDLLNKSINAVYDSRRLVTPEAGDYFVISGAFWIYAHYDMLLDFKVRGVKFCVFIHDLIQVSNPEYVHHEATIVFRRAFSDVVYLADFLLANSEYVANDVRKYCKDRFGIDMPVIAVPLATELTPPAETGKAIPREIVEASKTDYVLSVSTIEIRKNHKYLIKLWERMIKEFDGPIPNLILVGKWGWSIDDLREYIEQSDYLGGRLYIFNGIDDASLSLLYKNSMFTMFPSFAEGFGLPVGESLAYGKLCLSSNRTSMPEVGGKYARYYDPDDLNEGYRLVTSLLSNKKELNALNQEIQKSYKTKDWETFSLEFYDAVTSTKTTRVGDGVRCTLPEGEVIGMGSDEILNRDAKNKQLIYLSATRRTGWFPVEPWGCWTSARRAQIKFQTDLRPNEKIMVYLSLVMPPNTENPKCQISINGIDTVVDEFGETLTWAVAEGAVGEAGVVTVNFLSSGRYSAPDHRDLFVGLKALAYCRREDFAARTSLLEKFVLGSLLK